VNIKLYIIALLMLLSNIAIGQTFNYAYTDPCNGKIYNLTIPYGANQLAVTYYGQVQAFTAADFNNGTFDAWASNVYNQYKNASPCGSIGTTTTVSQTQGTALNVVSILNSLSTIADAVGSGTSNIMGAASSISNVGGTGDNASSGSSSSGGSSEQKGSNNSSTSSSSSSGSNSSGSGSNSSGSGSGGSGSGGSGSGGSGSGGSGGDNSGGSGGSGGSGSGGSGSGGDGSGSGGSGSGGGQTGSGGTTTSSSSGSGSGNGTGNNSSDQSSSSDKKSDAIGGTTNAVKSAPSGGSSNGDKKSSGGSTDKNGAKPSILASSDLVGFSFKNGDVTSGAKINAGYTSVRYDGLRSHGFMVDYTSSIKGPNITGYYAWIKPKAVTLLANTLTVGFAGAGSIYNTVAFGQMRNLRWKIKAVYMMTGSAGQIYKEPYYGTALIAGFNRDNKFGKRIQVKTMALFVYAPFVRYYNDVVLKSPYVVLPIIGANFSVTKTFKLNLNFGGAYSIGDNVLNYTIMMGTRLAL
jgi:hypothetical protein